MDGVGDHQHVLFCSSRAPSAFLENVDQREIVETTALRGHLAWPWGWVKTSQEVKEEFIKGWSELSALKGPH